jgi:enoyl-CoA hydratase
LLAGSVLDAEEAHREGLFATLSADPLTEALALAREVEALEPWLARSIRRAVHVAATQGLEATLELESWAQAASMHSSRFREYVSSFGGRADD